MGDISQRSETVMKAKSHNGVVISQPVCHSIAFGGSRDLSLHHPMILVEVMQGKVMVTVLASVQLDHQ
jgi:glycerol-3-phosphate responsive antiterminator